MGNKWYCGCFKRERERDKRQKKPTSIIPQVLSATLKVELSLKNLSVSSASTLHTSKMMVVQVLMCLAGCVGMYEQFDIPYATFLNFPSSAVNVEWSEIRTFNNEGKVDCWLSEGMFLYLGGNTFLYLSKIGFDRKEIGIFVCPHEQNSLLKISK